MADLSEKHTDLILTPHGRLLLETGTPPSPWVDEETARRVGNAFGGGEAKGLLALGTRELKTILPPAVAWWREWARRYLTQLCHTPEQDRVIELAPVPAPPELELSGFIETAPPMRGGEYLNADLLRRLWMELDDLVRAEVKHHGQSAADWLKEQHPLWRTVGRVTFHLAENKKHPTHPFAFMATYASRMSSESRVQHLPLGRALQEYAGAQNKGALVNLLSPIQKAAEASEFVRQLVDSARIFKALPWTPREAYQFLKAAPVCEAAGVIVRLPDWWKSGRPPRPRVSVRIGEGKPAGVGVEALLDFSAQATLEGEPLSEEEWRALMSATEGLALVRGKWVEVDKEKLQQALAHWKRVEKMARNEGLSFFEGMRLMSGLRDTAPGSQTVVEPASDREWSGIEAGEWLNQALRELREPSAANVSEPVPNLRAELRPYQAVGVSWLWFLSRLGLGGCLADDMGLGKTLQILALLLKRKAAGGTKGQPSILVVPASLLANWRAEINRFAPALTFRIVHPSEPESGKPEDATDVDLMITTYGMLSRLDALRESSWDLAVLDEAQAIKNAETRQARAVKQLKAMSRFALTGTPVENRAGDLWSIFDFLNPGLLGSASEFSRYIKAQERAQLPDYGPLRAITKPYILRRLKTDKRIIADLPDKTEVRAWCSLSKTQAALYQKAVAELTQGLQEASGIQRKGLVLAFIMRFKQICNHPSQWLSDSGYAPEQSGKFDRLRELAEQIRERQEKVLIFTQFREITDPLAGFLGQVFGRPGLVLHGGTPVVERRKRVEAFQRDEGPPFFLLTVKAGGTGLNLTQAAHVIHFDRWWNPAVENQATDRAFRIGQKQNVLVHKFVCRGTVEERIDQLIEDKKALSTELLEGGGEKLLTEMNNEELLAFVALDLRRATGA